MRSSFIQTLFLYLLVG